MKNFIRNFYRAQKIEAGSLWAKNPFEFLWFIAFIIIVICWICLGIIYWRGEGVS